MIMTMLLKTLFYLTDIGNELPIGGRRTKRGKKADTVDATNTAY